MRHRSPHIFVSSCASTISAMAVFKRKYPGGKTVLCFVIDAPGSTREVRRQIKESGFPTKAAAEHAEAGSGHNRTTEIRTRKGWVARSSAAENAGRLTERLLRRTRGKEAG